MKHSLAQLSQLRQANNTKELDKTSSVVRTRAINRSRTYANPIRISPLEGPRQQHQRGRRWTPGSAFNPLRNRKRRPPAHPTGHRERRLDSAEDFGRRLLRREGIYLGFGDWGICGRRLLRRRGERRSAGRDETRRMGKEASGGGNRKRRPAFSSWRPVGRLSAPPQPSDQLRYDVAVQIWKTNNPSR